MCKSVLPECMYVHHGCAWCSWGPGKEIRFPGPGDRGGCELPCRSWELNPGLLREQQVLLTAEPFLLPELTQYCGVNSVPFNLKILLSVIVSKSDSLKH